MEPNFVSTDLVFLSHSTHIINLLISTLNEVGLDLIVAAVTVLTALVVHLITLRVGGRTTGAPQEPALIVVGPARALITESLSVIARLPVDLENIGRTILALAGAVFRQIALVVGAPALRAGVFRSAGLQIAAFTGGAARVAVQHAGGHVAARIVAVLLQTAVALLARLNESVAAYRAVEELLRLVPQTIVHSMVEGESQVLQRA